MNAANTLVSPLEQLALGELLRLAGSFAQRSTIHNVGCVHEPTSSAIAMIK